jgi:response regulator RpfG family c-di-GMP phosphodiesterase
MTSAHFHKILVVDDEPQVGKAIGRLLAMEKLESVYAKSGESALEMLKSAPQPFSLIISDQKMPGMEGTQFLEQAKILHPETIRFLITGYSQMETIINAVNKGAVQRYISKPWDNDELVVAIRSGIKQYERFLENNALITLAKKQNAKLYELNCELMENAKTHNKERILIDTEIESIDVQLKEITSCQALNPSQIMEKLQAITPLGGQGQKMLGDLYSQTIIALFDEFNDLALKNGFEIRPLVEGKFIPSAGNKGKAP